MTCRECGSKADAIHRNQPYCAKHALEKAKAERKAGQ